MLRRGSGLGGSPKAARSQLRASCPDRVCMSHVPSPFLKLAELFATAMPCSSKFHRVIVPKVESGWDIHACRLTEAGSAYLRVAASCIPGTHVCLSTCSPSTISSILGAWLDQYSEDFRKPPDYACLKQLISYVRHNIPGSDLERRARILLAQFQQQERSEAEAEGEQCFLPTPGAPSCSVWGRWILGFPRGSGVKSCVQRPPVAGT